MEFKGRLTADAQLRNTTTGKQVISFSVAESNDYRSNGEWVKRAATFYRCSYWFNPAELEKLKKGTTVIINGRLAATTYTSNGTNEVKSALDVTITDIAYPVSRGTNHEVVAAVPRQAAAVATTDDLPF